MLKQGAMYLVEHRIKGRFKLWVTSEDDFWADGVIAETSGDLKMGDRVTVRKHFCEMELVEGEKKCE